MSFKTSERFADILENLDRIQAYTCEISRETFLGDLKTQDAVERCIARISEAAVKLGKEAEDLCPSIAWRDIRGIGNHLRHAYDGVEPSQIWNVIQNDLPILRKAVDTAITGLETYD